MFEARKGWVAVSPEGSMWRHRGGGTVGVLVFERAEDGGTQFHATHQDCFSSDTSLTTTSRRKAVRFAVTGSTAPARSLSRGATAPDAAAAERAAHEARAGSASIASDAPSEAPDAALADADLAKKKSAIVSALLGLSPADRAEVLARLAAAEPS